MFDRLGLQVPAGGMWDAATLVVAPAYRTAAATGLVCLGLYQSLVRAARASGVEWLCAVLDTVVFRVAQAKFAGPFEPYADGRPYLGSKSSLPVTVNFAGWKDRLAAREPEIHDIIYEGVGIEPVMRPVPIGVASALADNPPSTSTSTKTTVSTTNDEQGDQNDQADQNEQGDDEQDAATDVTAAANAVETEADNSSADDQSGDQQDANDNSEEPGDTGQSDD